MNKYLLTMICAVCWTISNAQELKLSGQTHADLIPQGWEITDAEGDVNHDGITDWVVIATPNSEEHLQRRDDGYVYNFNPPILAIYWGTNDGTFRLWNQYKDVIPPRPDEYHSIDHSVSITPKGVITIGFSYFSSAGGWSNTSYSYLFRYQNNDFFLIGKDEHEMARNTGEASDISYNYLTRKKQYVTFNEFDEKVKRKEKWSSLPKSPLKRLGSWMLGEEE